MTTDTTNTRGHWRELAIGFEDALTRLPAALKKEGFGVLTEIDVTATLKAKLGVDFRRYRILGACNPSFAHAALLKDPHIGVLLPCNIAIYETDDGKAIVGAVDPMQTLGANDAAAGVAELAGEVGARLERVLDDLAS